MDGLVSIVSEEFDAAFGLSPSAAAPLKIALFKELKKTFEETSILDAVERMAKVAASATTILVDHFTGPEASVSSLSSLPGFRSKVASRLTTLLDHLRRDYLSGAKGPAPASRYLNKTRPVYEFVRLTLGIRMHGSENYHRFSNGLGVEDVTVGQNVSLIHEAIRDGKLQSVVVNLFS
jgi:phenylalanine ammonia-lyase